VKYLRTYEGLSYDYTIVVDVQPGHEDWIDFDIQEFCDWLNNTNRSIIYLYNGPDLGYEDENEIRWWLFENGLDEDVANGITFFEKNYAFFRDLMDSGADDEEIIELGKYMIENDERDSRDIERENQKKIKIRSKFFSDDYMMYIPELYDFLSNFLDKNSYPLLVGGGRDQCLKEVELLLKMMDIEYETDEDYIY